MLSDKLYAISGDRVCRRMKDVLDIYVMSFITKIDMDELHQIWIETGRELGDFETYKTQSAKLGEADFIDVYSRVTDVICKLERHKGIETPTKKTR